MAVQVTKFEFGLTRQASFQTEPRDIGAVEKVPAFSINFRVPAVLYQDLSLSSTTDQQMCRTSSILIAALLAFLALVV